MAALPELSNTAYVLLGFIDAEPRSGYDIKQLADHSTRFFWQISYGQIYPELKRLVDLGLLEQDAHPRGGRTRHLYRITAAGRGALRTWLEHAGPPGSFEMRDELLLKLFFVDAAGADAKRRVVERLRLREEATLAELRALEPHARELVPVRGPTKLQVLLGGIRLHEAYLAVLEDIAAHIS